MMRLHIHFRDSVVQRMKGIGKVHEYDDSNKHQKYILYDNDFVNKLYFLMFFQPLNGAPDTL